MRPKNRNKAAFWESGMINDVTFMHYFRKLTEVATTIYQWENVPDNIDIRFLELALFTDGQAVLFKDDVLREYMGLRCIPSGGWNVYNVPKKRQAYATNGYHINLDENNSVIVYNNYMRTPTKVDAIMYAQRLWDLDRTIDVNAKAQKTPVILSCPENLRFSILNLYKKWSGNEPFIISDPKLDMSQIKVLNTGAPYNADKIYNLKTNIWNEALESMGVPNLQNEKRERMIDKEISTTQGATRALRCSGLEMRQKACEQFNNMFGEKMSVRYRDDIDVFVEVNKE